ncbi:class I SAM-dependent methyltransferase [Actinoplanes flavus]|uniref:Class I SAM-dependent methyltransferase n=1 Tax=Actinoplanes flavus TaxID=2820290 RepID=A0ABS3UMU3_9ACTN|nr:class I SAM-dependent methyltransferase [Actinoplanes flavus]MBO3740089.1 class I SAM-dependent methyltransferase [Actinoplanes flavus]
MRDDDHWARYNAHQGDRPIREQCARVMSLAGPGAGRTAADLGCGAGLETAALLAAGWRVVAVDGEPGTPARLSRAAGDRQAMVTVRTTRFQDLSELPPTDLIYAGYSLPFQTRSSFDPLWTVLRASLRPGGRIAVDLFGDHDSWAGDPDMTFLTEAEARGLFDGLVIEHWHERDEPGTAFSGPKHWHVFEVIALQPLDGDLQTGRAETVDERVTDPGRGGEHAAG